MTIVERSAGFWYALRGCLLAAALTLSALPANAVEQTNGAGVIPKEQAGTSCESHASVCINANEVVEGGAGDIDAVAQATISQETFNPLCELTFRVVARGAGYKNTFGWYAVKRDTNGVALAPLLSDMHVFLDCDDPIGAEETLTLPTDVGEIGFFLANEQGNCAALQADPLGPTLIAKPKNLFYSQVAFNSDASGMIHLLVWQSRANPDAFYFGWEDLTGGGDNDFEDLLTYVTGIQCAGGGEPCQAEGEGVCGDGVLQCQDGKLECVPTQKASDEKCNGLDDDCNGETDEGDGLCQQGEICVKGNCEPPCGSAEFRCSNEEVCVEGVCLPVSCATKSCPSGSVCRDGECVAPCDDVVCPYGANCRNGLCVNVCEGIECDPGFACEVRQSSDAETLIGVCSSCDCRGCGDGLSCVDHLCLEDACKNQTCDAGAHCVGGECVDNCADAKCPSGQVCTEGRCEHDPSSGSGGEGNASNASGGDGGLILDPGSMGGNANGSGGDDSNGQIGDRGGTIEVKGCGCAVPGSGSSSRWPLGLAGLLVVAGASRSRRRRR